MGLFLSRDWIYLGVTSSIEYLITWNFQDTLISRISRLKKKSRKISVAKITWRENYVKRYVNNQERISLLPLSVLQNVCKSKGKWIVDLTLQMWTSTLKYRCSWNQFTQLGWWKCLRACYKTLSTKKIVSRPGIVNHSKCEIKVT